MNSSLSPFRSARSGTDGGWGLKETFVVHYHLTAATNDDFDFVYELKKIAYKEYIDQTWGWDDAFQMKFHKENFSARNTHIIKAGDRAIGSVDVKEVDTGVFISGLYILPEFQSKGIGTQIISNLIKMAEDNGKRLELEVLRVNTRALQLYERLGFTKTEGDKTKYFMTSSSFLLLKEKERG